MSNLNVVVLTGNLVRDPELRYTQSGIPVASFTIASNYGFGDNQQTAFIPCVVWDKKAEALCDHKQKGDEVHIRGYLQTRSYEDKEGIVKYVMEVVADMVSYGRSVNRELEQEEQPPKQQNNQRPNNQRNNNQRNNQRSNQNQRQNTRNNRNNF